MPRGTITFSPVDTVARTEIAQLLPSDMDWTPGLAFGGGTTGITYSSQIGKYTKFGNWVMAQFEVILSNKGSSTGATTITGLPSAGLTGLRQSGVISFTAGFSILNLLNPYTPIIFLDGGTSIELWHSGFSLPGAVTNTQCTNTTRINGSLVYVTN